MCIPIVSWLLKAGVRGWMTGAYLRQLHHHVGKDVQEAHHGVPEPAVCQGLLVPRARTLEAVQRIN